MFSLIITIISIVLVAALALATLYYGGTSWTRGNAAAFASTLTNQGQQIRGAMELFYSHHSAYPNSLEQLVAEGYLKTVPIPPETLAALEATVITPVLAVDEEWTLLAAGKPAFMVQEKVSREVCQELNYVNRGSDVVYKKIDGKSYAQCYGEPEGPFTFIVGVPGSGNVSLRAAVLHYNATNDPDLPLALAPMTEDDVAIAETRNKGLLAQAPDTEGGEEGDENGDEGNEGEDGENGDEGTPAAAPLRLYAYPDEGEVDVTATGAWYRSYDVNDEHSEFDGENWFGIRNSSDTPVVIESYSYTGPFTVIDDTCVGLTLGPDVGGEPYCDIGFNFAIPSVPGNYTGSLTYIIDGTAQTFPLSVVVTDRNAPPPEQAQPGDGDGIELGVVLEQNPYFYAVDGSMVLIWAKHATQEMRDVSVQVMSAGPAIRWPNIWGEVEGPYIDSDVSSEQFYVYNDGTGGDDLLKSYFSKVTPYSDDLQDEFFVGWSQNGCATVPAGQDCGMFIAMTHPYSGGRCEVTQAVAPTVFRLRYRVGGGPLKYFDFQRTFTLGGPGTCI